MGSEKKIAVVALGSNMAPREEYLREALLALGEIGGTRVLRASSVIETDGVGVPEEFRGQKFLNQAAMVETNLEALEFFRRMHAIEDRLGRVRTVRNGPRTIDLDLIAFGTERMETEELTLPHPRAAGREFVMAPLRELGLDGCLDWGKNLRGNEKTP